MFVRNVQLGRNDIDIVMLVNAVERASGDIVQEFGPANPYAKTQCLVSSDLSDVGPPSYIIIQVSNIKTSSEREMYPNDNSFSKDIVAEMHSQLTGVRRRVKSVVHTKHSPRS